MEFIPSDSIETVTVTVWADPQDGLLENTYRKNPDSATSALR